VRVISNEREIRFPAFSLSSFLWHLHFLRSRNPPPLFILSLSQCSCFSCPSVPSSLLLSFDTFSSILLSLQHQNLVVFYSSHLLIFSSSNRAPTFLSTHCFPFFLTSGSSLHPSFGRHCHPQELAADSCSDHPGLSSVLKSKAFRLSRCRT
jgi:hypothetical protein